jgi:glucose/arabinose dehydrogenase
VKRALLIAVVALATACTAVKEDEAATTTTAVASPSTTVAGEPSSTTTTTTPLPTIDTGQVELQQLAEVDQPVAFAARAGDPALYIAEREGRIRRIEIVTTSRRRSGSTTPVTTQTFTIERTPVLDISDEVVSEGQEQGLLGLAFSTDGNRLYVAYTGADSRQYLDEYPMGAERPDSTERREILVVDDFAPNHNGGQLAFGPDGFLYWAMGDGGGGGDPQDTGQDPNDLLGSILRIDPDVLDDAAQPYAVPDGNPFAGGGGAPEVWAYGLRNPWRFSFDRITGDLWIADVGQGEVEEIDFLPATDDGRGAGRGANLGWSNLEGDQSFEGRDAPEGAVPPVHVYGRDRGCSVTGGFVYRGDRIPEMVGAYIYGDFCEGEVRALVVDEGEVVDDRVLGLSVPNLSSFGQDPEGELYALSLDGPVYRLVPAGS